MLLIIFWTLDQLMKFAVGKQKIEHRAFLDNGIAYLLNFEKVLFLPLHSLLSLLSLLLLLPIFELLCSCYKTEEITHFIRPMISIYNLCVHK